MFISREKYERLHKRISDLERVTERQGQFLHRDYNRLERFEEVAKQVGKRKRNIFESLYGRHLFSAFGMGYDDSEETKELTLMEEVEQIKSLLGIEEKVTTSSRKLVLKAKAEKAPVKKTAKKAKK